MAPPHIFPRHLSKKRCRGSFFHPGHSSVASRSPRFSKKSRHPSTLHPEAHRPGCELRRGACIGNIPWILRSMGCFGRSMGCFCKKYLMDLRHIVAKNAFRRPSEASKRMERARNQHFPILRMGVRSPPGGKRCGPEVKKVRLRGCCRLFAPLSCGSPCARLPPRTSHSPLALHFLWLRPSLAAPRESEEKLRFSSLSSRLALTLHP